VGYCTRLPSLARQARPAEGWVLSVDKRGIMYALHDTSDDVVTREILAMSHGGRKVPPDRAPKTCATASVFTTLSGGQELCGGA